MQLHQIGELDLLKEIRKRFSPKDSSVVVGIGDDAAVIAPSGHNVLVTTDMMSEGIHFDLSFTSPFHLGFKLVSVNVSDIMAMGGRPQYLFLNMSVKKDLQEDFFWEMYRGISAAMSRYGVELLGGDLSSAKNDMVLSATVIGTADRIITRGGASVGDKIYVTGTPGDSACGLEMLKRLTRESKDIIKAEGHGILNSVAVHTTDMVVLLSSGPTAMSGDIAGPLVLRHLMPVARTAVDIAPHATAMIDVSDGLFIDLCRTCDESNVGARIYLDRVPMSGEMRRAADIMGLDPMSLAVSGGEDYELLFTAPADTIISEVIDGHSPLKITCIGEITDKERVVIDSAGGEHALKAEGYRHFGAP